MESVRREEDNDPLRFTTMSVATPGDCVVTHSRRTYQLRQINRTDDIPGAQPGGRESRLSRDRPNFLRSDDIEGACPSSSYRFLNKPSFVNRNDDIDGSQPRPSGFRTKRCVNPLEPEYQLPHVETRPPTPPPQHYETCKLDDIPGAKPAPLFRFHPRRTTMDVDDIPGTRPKFVPEEEKPEPRDIMNVKDINRGGKFRSHRVTDPLRPVHVIFGRKIEDDPGTHPRQRRVQRKEPDFSLTTTDIEGAQGGYRAQHAMGGLPLSQRRQFRATNFVGDIDGACAGSLKTTLQTERHTNPLDRNYTSLDGGKPKCAGSQMATMPGDMAGRQLKDPRQEQTMRSAAVESAATLPVDAHDWHQTYEKEDPEALRQLWHEVVSASTRGPPSKTKPESTSHTSGPSQARPPRHPSSRAHEDRPEVAAATSTPVPKLALSASPRDRSQPAQHSNTRGSFHSGASSGSRRSTAGGGKRPPPRIDANSRSSARAGAVGVPAPSPMSQSAGSFASAGSRSIQSGRSGRSSARAQEIASVRSLPDTPGPQ